MLNFIRTRLWWWRNFHRPRHLVGAVVKNRYSGVTATLQSYIGPHLGWIEDKQWMITEKWLTTEQYQVAVGYFWLAQFNPQRDGFAPEWRMK